MIIDGGVLLTAEQFLKDIDEDAYRGLRLRYPRPIENLGDYYEYFIVVISVYKDIFAEQIKRMNKIYADLMRYILE